MNSRIVFCIDVYNRIKLERHEDSKYLFILHNLQEVVSDNPNRDVLRYVLPYITSDKLVYFIQKCVVSQLYGAMEYVFSHYKLNIGDTICLFNQIAEEGTVESLNILLKYVHLSTFLGREEILDRACTCRNYHVMNRFLDLGFKISHYVKKYSYTFRSKKGIELHKKILEICK